MRTAQKVILITGAAKRLGRLLALELSHRYAIAIHYHHSHKEAKSLLKQLQKQNCTSAIFKANLSKVTQIEKTVSAVVKHFGRIDVLINNAAIFYKTPFGQIKEKDWNLFLDTNLKGPFFCAQAVARYLLKQKENKTFSKIINISDSGGPRTRTHYIPYWISKAGLMAMTETMAKIFSPKIQVNTIAPGPLLFPENETRLKNQMPINPHEIVKAVRYLLETTAVTGNTLIIDSGRRYR